MAEGAMSAVSLPEAQREVGAFLQGLAGRPPLQTHISAVYVGPADAWKLKKAVHLPYLDFSTEPKRRRFIEREFVLNAPEAPEIYREVLAVERGAGGELALRRPRDARAPLDWVLRMAPIPQDAFLDKVAENGSLSPEILDALGDCVARSHDRRPPVRHADSAGALAAIAEGCTRNALAAGLPDDTVAEWDRLIGAQVENLRFWLQAREAAGLVRRCHGDLHLGNICLWRGAPVLFDALEFDEAMATIDVGYDLAFLLMDLDMRVGRAAANRVMNRYLALTGDAGVSRGLPAFMSLRAMVRAVVARRWGDADAATDYLHRALAHIRPAAALVLAIGGLQGTGKSTLARRVAPDVGRAPGAVILRSDVLRKRVFGVRPEQPLPKSGYSDAADAAVRQLLTETTRVVAGGGHAVIADATFLDAALRAALAEAARAAGCRFIGIWLQAPPDVLEQRVRARRNDASDATLALLARSSERDAGRMTWHCVDSRDAAAAEARIKELVEPGGKMRALSP